MSLAVRSLLFLLAVALVGGAWLTTLAGRPAATPDELVAEVVPAPAERGESVRSDAPEQIERELAPSVVGAVVGASGLPQAGVHVRMLGSDRTTRTQTDDDGSFVFRTSWRGPCRAEPGDGWLAVRSPLLELCSAADAPVLLVARAARLQGRVCDADGAPVADARVAVELDVAFGDMAAAAKNIERVQLLDEWSTTTDADGWYLLPVAPVGEGARLAVERPGFRDHREPLPPTRGYRMVTLRPVVEVAAAPDRVASPIARANGRFAIRLLDGAGRPHAGWWAEAVAVDDGHGLRAAATRAPSLVAPDGRVEVAGRPGQRYRIEAWHPRNRAVLRSPVVRAQQDEAVVRVAAARPPAVVRGQVVDRAGAPVVGTMVGLARPTGWAVPGTLGMHVEPVATTGRDGTFALQVGDAAALELVVAGTWVVPTRVPIELASEPAVVEIEVERRLWLGADLNVARPMAGVGSTGDTIASPSVSLGARDSDGNELPLWRAASPMPHVRFAFAGGEAIGVPASTRRLVLWRGRREVGGVRLRP
ncbi:MAG: carboxypeptidase regulatory-like domain-containing protein [Planctomycetes bacterium]|nr:carboxypeptidase regulatory-like domain-containing protein [Planctomycetota bacterium]